MSCPIAANVPAFFPQSKVALSPLTLVGIVPRVAGKSTRELRLRQLVEAHVDFVARILRNAGTAQADIDDDVQRVFIALSNRLDDVQIGAEKSFLLQTALHMAAHARRTAARRREVITDSLPEIVDPLATPEELADRSQLRRTLDRILSTMDTDLRIVFVLFEIEEMTTAEIATTLKIPAGTVASRLRRARADFHDRVAMIENCQKSEVG
jgi:RNA polymerase sigma-70 factor, ECF subfamily